MFGLGAGEILVIGVIALIFIGPKKLPELAKGLGKGIREFQKAKNDLMTEVDKEAITEDVKKTVSELKSVNPDAGPHYVNTAAEEFSECTEAKSEDSGSKKSEEVAKSDKDSGQPEIKTS